MTRSLREVADVFKAEVSMEKESVVSEVVLASSNSSQCRGDARLPPGEGDAICGRKLSSTRGEVWDAKLKLYVCWGDWEVLSAGGAIVFLFFSPSAALEVSVGVVVFFPGPGSLMLASF